MLLFLTQYLRSCALQQIFITFQLFFDINGLWEMKIRALNVVTGSKKFFIATDTPKSPLKVQHLPHQC